MLVACPAALRLVQNSQLPQTGNQRTRMSVNRHGGTPRLQMRSFHLVMKVSMELFLLTLCWPYLTGGQDVSGRSTPTGQVRGQPQEDPSLSQGTSTTQPLVGVSYDLTVSEKVNVYVYDTPQLDHSTLVECYMDSSEGIPPWQHEQEETAQNMAEIWIHRALLAHPWRVLDAEKADVFYVPVYPVLSKLHDCSGELWRHRRRHQTCGGITHNERMTAAVDYLRHESIFFNRVGGADHFLTCGWWACHMALEPLHRMVLRRVIFGNYEQTYWWVRSGCGADRVVTIPYVASSMLTTSSMLEGLAFEERNISFYFAGSSRARQERRNLDVSRVERTTRPDPYMSRYNIVFDTVVLITISLRSMQWRDSDEFVKLSATRSSTYVCGCDLERRN